MGAEPYWYVVKYEDDIDSALQSLRRREFLAGRYNPVMPFPGFPLGPNPPAPGAGHATIAEAIAEAGADGTRSILDLERVSDELEFGVVATLADEKLIRLFGTTRPSRQVVESNHDFWDGIERGEGIYVVLYKNDKPDEFFFAGYSCD